MNITYGDTVAFIPVRGGSKSIPLKNIKDFCGKPLVYWTLKAASNAEFIKDIYVSTDSQDISAVVKSFNFKKVHIVNRSPETATDTASTEMAMLEFAKNNDFDNICLIQATSPLLTEKDLVNGWNVFMKENVDSVLSVVAQKRFIWDEDFAGVGKAQNYDPQARPRRQDFKGYYVENGAFYITSRKNLINYKCRISGNIGLAVMPDDTYFEIDEPSDWIFMEELMHKRINLIYKKRFEKIKYLVTDVDGVLTDGGMYYSDDGKELKKFNTRDGMGIEKLRCSGIETIILTGEQSDIVTKRARKLKVSKVYLGIKDKEKILEEIIQGIPGATYEEFAYIGDDVNDLSAMKKVGFSAAPSDANEKVISNVDYICSKKGGEGCVRELCEMILASRSR